jgi:hypothetical protein
MHRSRVFAVAAVLLLSSCATVENTRFGPITISFKRDLGGFDPAHVHVPNGNDTNIHVVNGGLVVDQEPMRPTPGAQQMVTVTWALSKAGNYTFPDDTAIYFKKGTDEPPVAQCGRHGPSGKFFICQYTSPGPGKAWRYNIRVKDAGGNELKLDPWFFQ